MTAGKNSFTNQSERIRHRDSLAKSTFMKPGDIYTLLIDICPTSNLFAKCHRIRVDISSSNFPRFDLNPNTGNPLQQNRRMIVADSTVFHDAKRPLQIVLPVIIKEAHRS